MANVGRIRGSLSLFALGALAACSAAPSERVGEAGEQVIGGTVLPADNSGMIKLTTTASGPGTLCTGLLVSNDWTLTAKHCFSQADIDTPYNSVTLTMGSQQNPGVFVAVHPTLDVAVVASAPFTMNGSAQYYLRWPSFSPTSAIYQRTVTCYGYGATDWTTFGGSGVLRSVDLTVYTYDPNNPAVFWVGPNGPGPNLAKGDSGGPCLYNGWFAGVTSQGAPNAPTTEVAISGIIPWVNQSIPEYGQNLSFTGGVGSNGFDYCAGAQSMCNIHRAPEYFRIAAECARLGGVVPACSFPTTTPQSCLDAQQACTMGDETGWRNDYENCLADGGSPPACPPWPVPVWTIPKGGGGGGTGGKTQG